MTKNQKFPPSKHSVLHSTPVEFTRSGNNFQVCLTLEIDGLNQKANFEILHELEPGVFVDISPESHLTDKTVVADFTEKEVWDFEAASAQSENYSERFNTLLALVLDRYLAAV